MNIMKCIKYIFLSILFIFFLTSIAVSLDIFYKIDKNLSDECVVIYTD